MSNGPWRIEHFETIDSTNTWLADQARAGAAEGLVAVSDFQLAGRGRRDRTWEAPPRSALLASVLLRPAVTLADAQLAVVAVALSVREALATWNVAATLKWPNDLLFEGRKLGGILAEVVSDPTVGIVVGFGINLSVAPPGAACVADAGASVDAADLLARTLDALTPRRAQLSDDEGRATLRRAYSDALDTLTRPVRVERDHDVLRGTAVGVDDAGRLLVDDGTAVHVISVGDVVHLRADEA